MDSGKITNFHSSEAETQAGGQSQAGRARVAEIYQHISRKMPGKTVATAESCTGGMISAWLTDPPGSSQFFVGSVCAYSNYVKTTVLGVPAAVIAEHGAVSAPVVEAMASGVIRLMGAEWAISVSGVAGPAGGTVEKPVGTVWCGIDGPSGVYSRLLRLSGDRRAIREAAALAALEFLLEKINEI